MSGTERLQAPRTLEAPRSLASDIALILANLVPLIGVLFRGWDVTWVLYTYWLENVVVGFFAMPRILLARGQAGLSPMRRSWMGGLGRALAFEAFLTTYAAFMIAHRFFLMMLFEPVSWPFEPLRPENIRRFLFGDPAFPRADLVVAILVLFVSHGLSFVRNFIMRGEFKVSNYQVESSRPAKRVFAMQLTIIVGGFLALMLGAPPAAVAVLVVTKIMIDLFVHIRVHETNLPLGG